MAKSKNRNISLNYLTERVGTSTVAAIVNCVRHNYRPHGTRPRDLSPSSVIRQIKRSDRPEYLRDIEHKLARVTSLADLVRLVGVTGAARVLNEYRSHIRVVGRSAGRPISDQLVSRYQSGKQIPNYIVDLFNELRM